MSNIDKQALREAAERQCMTTGDMTLTFFMSR